MLCGMAAGTTHGDMAAALSRDLAEGSGRRAGGGDRDRLRWGTGAEDANL